MSQKYKNFVQVEGSQFLLEAFVKEVESKGREYKGLGKYSEHNDCLAFHKDGSYGYVNYEIVRKLFLPQDWAKALEVVLEEEEEIKIGDWIMNTNPSGFAFLKVVKMNGSSYEGTIINIPGGVGLRKNIARKITNEELGKFMVEEAIKRGYKAGQRVHLKNGNCTTQSDYLLGGNIEWKSNSLWFNNAWIWEEQGGWAEIVKEEPIEYKGYKPIFVGNDVQFGCKSFNYADLLAYYKLLDIQINASINIGGKEVTREILERIMAKIKK